MTGRSRALLPVLGIVAALALGVVLARHVAVNPAENWGQAIGAVVMIGIILRMLMNLGRHTDQR